MDKNLEKLLNYQDTDKELKAIEDIINKDEDVISYRKSYSIIKQSSDLKLQVEQKAQSMLIIYNNLNADLNSLTEDIKEYAEEIDECTDVSQIKYLSKKFDETVAKANTIKNNIDELTGKLESIQKEFNTISVDYKKNCEIYNRTKEKYNSLREQYRGQMDEIRAKLLVLEKDVDPELMARYKEKRSKKMFPIVMKVVEDCCPYCKTNFSKVFLDDLTKGTLRECETSFCRRILYMEPEEKKNDKK